jgi:GTP 3',8-cyclase
VRRDLATLVEMIASVDGIEDISLSTNAVLLADQADALKEAGVNRVNVSLDSLRADRVDAIARRPGSFGRIMAGLEAAERVGFGPIKINVVLLKGQNDSEIADFAAITKERPWHIRFIELMPTGVEHPAEHGRVRVVPGSAPARARARRPGAGGGAHR